MALSLFSIQFFYFQYSILGTRVIAISSKKGEIDPRKIFYIHINKWMCHGRKIVVTHAYQLDRMLTRYPPEKRKKKNQSPFYSYTFRWSGSENASNHKCILHIHTDSTDIHFALFFNLKCTFIRLYDSSEIENVDWMRWNRISLNYKFIDSNRMIFIDLRLCFIYISAKYVYLRCCSGKSSNFVVIYFIHVARLSAYKIWYDETKLQKWFQSNDRGEHGIIWAWSYFSMHIVKWFRNCISAEKNYNWKSKFAWKLKK